MRSLPKNVCPLILAGCCCALPALVAGQSPPGPLPQASSQTPAQTSVAPAKVQSAPDVSRTRNLAGCWKLNHDESSKPRERDDSGRSGNGGGGRSGGAWPGGGHGGRGGMRRGPSEEERKAMEELMRPWETLEISQDGPVVHLRDDRERHRVFYTDGRKVKKSKDADDQEYSAKWDGYRLVAEYKGPDGNQIDRTLELVEGNQQLREAIHFTVGRNHREVYLRYVYDLIPPQK